jgi:hypothetical protein
MTTMPNYPTTDDLALPSVARASARSKNPALANATATLASAEKVYDHTISQSRLGAAGFFFVAAALAVWAPWPVTAFTAVFLALAVAMSASANWMALRGFRQEIERSARAEGMSEREAQRVAASMTAVREAEAEGEAEADAEARI